MDGVTKSIYVIEIYSGYISDTLFVYIDVNYVMALYLLLYAQILYVICIIYI